MKSTKFPELEGLRFELSESVVERQLATIEVALRDPVPANARRPLAGWRRLVASLAVGGAILVPAAALAADGALPGDPLYRVKLWLEPLVEVFDRDVVAEHRIEELERLTERSVVRDSVIDGLLNDAAEALTEIDSPSLVERYEAVRDRHSGPRGDEVDDGAPVGDRPAPPMGETTTTIRNGDDTPATDRPADPTTTTAPGDRPNATDAPTTTTGATTTTTVPPRDGDGGRDGPTTTAVSDRGGDQP